ncbi:MAG TPA: hypothetical protein DCM40_26295, partial [Maribacter sp.]|nr:hypothetical protein [Maribacter sp.]
MSKIKSPLKQNEDTELIKLSDADAQNLFNENFVLNEDVLDNKVEEKEEEEEEKSGELPNYLKNEKYREEETKEEEEE